MTDKKPSTQLSYSSATLLKNCQQKYYYHKVDTTVEKDPDYENNETAFNVGKAFHEVMELNNHTEEDLEGLLDQACIDYDVEDHKAMLHAMLLRYLQVHKKSGLTAHTCEFTLSNEHFIGFIDIILVDEEGNWWIGDLKTAARYSEITTARLPMDTQLNLYTSFYKQIAGVLELDVKKFKGSRYRVTTKYKLKRKLKEGYYDFVKRLAKGIKSYDIAIPLEEMDPDGFYADHMELHKLSMEFRSGKAIPKRNRSYCDSYFRPCEFWSQCHAKTYSESGKLEVFKSNNA
jgi:hypothetical protein